MRQRQKTILTPRKSCMAARRPEAGPRHYAGRMHVCTQAAAAAPHTGCSAHSHPLIAPLEDLISLLGTLTSMKLGCRERSQSQEHGHSGHHQYAAVSQGPLLLCHHTPMRSWLSHHSVRNADSSYPRESATRCLDVPSKQSPSSSASSNAWLSPLFSCDLVWLEVGRQLRAARPRDQ